MKSRICGELSWYLGSFDIERITCRVKSYPEVWSIFV